VNKESDDRTHKKTGFNIRMFSYEGRVLETVVVQTTWRLAVKGAIRSRVQYGMKPSRTISESREPHVDQKTRWRGGDRCAASIDTISGKTWYWVEIRSRKNRELAGCQAS